MKRHALLIGADCSADQQIAPLQYAAADARDLGLTLRERCPFDQVTVLAGLGREGEPTRERILAELACLAQEVRAEDLVLIGVSCVSSADANGDTTLMLADSSVGLEQSNGLAVDQLLDLAGSMAARFKVLLFDTDRRPQGRRCGGADQVAPEMLRSSRRLSEARGRGDAAGSSALFWASDEGNAHEWPEFGHGVFSHFLLEGLRGAAWEGGRLTRRGLADYADQEVRRWSRLHRQKQCPCFEFFGLEEIALAKISKNETTESLGRS